MSAELFGTRGPMSTVLRGFDWGGSALGVPDAWPTSLRTIVGVVMGSRFPMLVWWGPELRQIYNDAYRPILGDKHPASVCAPGQQVWSEVWHILGPMADSILAGGPPTWNEHLLLPMQRKGFLEETFFTFSYSPIPGDDGSVGGVLVTVQETTQQVQGNRQLQSLRDLGAAAANARTAPEACSLAASILERNPADVPFSLLYLTGVDGRQTSLAASSGVAGDSIDGFARQLLNGQTGGWLNGNVGRSEGSLVDLPDHQLLPGGPLSPRAQKAVVLPLVRGEDVPPYGFAVFGLSPSRVVDDGYKGFLRLVADQVAAAITQARSLEDAQARADALEELDRAKTAFFSNVSHEFRTPLTLMLGPTEEALASEARALSGENLELLHRNELRLLKLVNALLDFARIEAGRVQARFQPTDLAVFTEDLVSMFRAAVERGGLTLTVQCDPTDTPVYVDRGMWEQVVMNLLSNALKFTPNGGITVTLRQNESAVVLEVADSGIGIAEADLPRLFQRFHRIEGAAGRTHEGTGIGLAMVHELVRLHGGRVSVSSRIGEGTTFSVELPRGPEHLPADMLVPADDPPSPTMAAMFTEEATQWLPLPAPLGERASPGTAGAGVVLIVDDNADMRSYLARLLQSRWTVQAAADTESALAAIRVRRPDLVLADVMMPGADGMALVRTLRADPATADIPIIVISARAGDEARVEGLRSGADDYIVKPFSPRELLIRVDARVADARARRERVELLQRERAARVEAELQKQHLHGLFMQAPTLVAVLRGADLVVELANDGMCRAWGRSQPALLGRPLLDAVPELRRQVFAPMLQEVFASGIPREGRETPFRVDAPGNNGDTLYFNFVYSPFRSAGGAVEGIFVIGSDVTDQVRARQQLEELQRAAEGANRAKDEFLAMLGHELRNPLSPIVTALQLMKLRGDGAERERTVIERQVAHLTRLVDDLLDVSRIARGKVDLKVEIVELSEVVIKAIEMASPLLEQRAHALELDVPRRGLRVHGDGTRLAQVVSNLLTNAAKYTPARGHITVTAVNDGDSVALRVRDSGIGISPEVLAHVFDLFVQERQGLDRAHGGLGLGLTIVRNLVQLHGGTVSAYSAGIGKGSEFVVRLPMAAPTATSSADDEPAPLAATGASDTRRVLVVDDNDDSAAMLADALRLRGHEVRVAHDGPAALVESASFHPDIAFLDIGLPVMDGYELAARLRQQPGLAHVKLLALTGYGQESDSARSKAAGFEEHLVKPLDLRHLDRLLKIQPEGRASDGARTDPRRTSS